MLKKTISGMMVLSLGLLILPPAFATGSSDGLMVGHSASGPWSSGSPAPGLWVTTNDADGAVLNLHNGIVAKLAKGSSVRYEGNSRDVKLSGLHGRLFMHLDKTASSVAIQVGTAQVDASRGEFIVDSLSPTKLNVINGDASVKTVAPKTHAAAKAHKLAKKSSTVALDGPDVRSRSTEEDEFNKKKKKKRAAGYQNNPTTPTTPPVQPTTPPVTTPPYTPPPTTPPPTTTTPPPEAPATAVAPAAGAGAATPWIVLGSVLVVGGGIALAVSGHSSSSSTVTSPASP